MDILLDSDVLIDYLSGKDNIIKTFAQSNRKLSISIISWIEVKYGLREPKKMQLFQKFFEDLQLTIIPIDLKVAEFFLNIKMNLENNKTPLADFDILIAATALANNIQLATRNIKHFCRIPKLKLI